MDLTNAGKLRRAILCSLLFSAMIVGFVIYTQSSRRGRDVLKSPRFWVEKTVIFTGFAGLILWNMLRDGPYARKTRRPTDAEQE